MPLPTASPPHFDAVSIGALRRGNKPPVILGEEKTLVYVNKTSRVIIVNGLATALLKYRGGFKRC